MTRLAEVKAEALALSKRLGTLETAIHDLVAGSPERTGAAIKVAVKANEVEPEALRLEATILRPNGAWPLVVIREADHVEVVAVEDWLAIESHRMSFARRTLRERVRVAIYRANHPQATE